MSDLFRDDVTAQELFDAVWTHFVVNGAPRSVVCGSCCYRGSNGAKCAVGLIVTDDECRDWEGSSVTGLFENERLPERLVPHRHLLGEMQDAHDFADGPARPSLVDGLREVATRHGLTVPS